MRALQTIEEDEEGRRHPQNARGSVHMRWQYARAGSIPTGATTHATAWVFQQRALRRDLQRKHVVDASGAASLPIRLSAADEHHVWSRQNSNSKTFGRILEIMRWISSYEGYDRT